MTMTKTLPGAVGGDGCADGLAAVDGDRVGSALGELTDCLPELVPEHPDAFARSRIASVEYMARRILEP
jgi:hypothetical protein